MEEESKLNITFEGTSELTGNKVRGYYVKLKGKDFIITYNGDRFPVTDVKLIHKDALSVLADINDAVDNNENIIVTLSLFRFRENGEDGTVGTVVASIRECLDMLYSWATNDDTARNTLITVALRILKEGAEDGHNCLECNKTSCPKHPQNIIQEMFPFIGKKPDKGLQN